MIKWEDLTVYQKAASWCVIGCIGCFAPEIALLLQFGGIEVTFAFIAVYAAPVVRSLYLPYKHLTSTLVLVWSGVYKSATARPKIYFFEAGFFALAFAATGSLAYASVFFIPGMLFEST